MKTRRYTTQQKGTRDDMISKWNTRCFFNVLRVSHQIDRGQQRDQKKRVDEDVVREEVGEETDVADLHFFNKNS